METTDTTETKDAKKGTSITAQLLVGAYWHEITYVEGSPIAEAIAKTEAAYGLDAATRTFKADGVELDRAGKMPAAAKLELVGARDDA